MGLDVTADYRQREIVDALRAVIDPCSQFNGTHLTIVDLGMVDSVDLGGDGAVAITLLLDDPLCLYASVICQSVISATLCVEGIEHVTVKIRTDELWTQERISEAAAQKLSHWREQRAAANGRGRKRSLRILL